VRRAVSKRRTHSLTMVFVIGALTVAIVTEVG